MPILPSKWIWSNNFLIFPTCTSVCMCVCIHVFVYVNKYACVCVYLHVDLCVSVCMCLCVSVSVCAGISAYVCTCLYVSVHVYVCGAKYKICIFDMYGIKSAKCENGAHVHLWVFVVCVCGVPNIKLVSLACMWATKCKMCKVLNFKK